MGSSSNSTNSGMMRQAGGSSSSFGFAAWRGAAEGMTVAHQHDDIELNLSATPLTYLIDGVTVTIAAHQLAVFWAAKPHQLVSDPAPAELAWATIPLTSFLGFGLPTSFVGNVLAGQLATADAAVYGDSLAAQFSLWSVELGSGSGYREATAALELQAVCRRVAASGDLHRHGAHASATAPATGALMAEYIATHAQEPIGVADVAGLVHLHPQYAMTLFRNQIGITVGEYLLQCRIAEAQRLLLTSTLPVPDVGFAAGFQSQSQFFARFRRAVGTTPAAYRRANAAG